MLSDTLKKLKKYGYGRQDITTAEHEYHTYCNKSYTKQVLNHSIMDHVCFEECNFDLAAVTGSIYRECSFVNNSFNEPDFEFCDFSDCAFRNQNSIVASFNGSNFARVKFYDISFNSCTFTNAYFEECEFIGGKIEFSTLENAVFNNCIFKNMELQTLNMDYVALNHPHMENVTLSLSQIPFMYGCLEYIRTTKDNVKIIGNKKKSFTPKEYFSEIIPLLIQLFEETKQYFPLANIYLSLEKYSLATNTLKSGISIACEQRDFRIIKYYCHLIARNPYFKPDILHMFYNGICRLSPQGHGMLNEQRSFARHIGEIKSILFGTNSMSSLHLTFRTNIFSQNVQKLSNILEAVFSIAKKDNGFGENKTDIWVTENSPLLIEIKVSGDTHSLIVILTALKRLVSDSSQIPTFSSNIDSQNILTKDLCALADNYSDKIRALSVTLVLVEYYLENLSDHTLEENIWYYNSSIKYIQQNAGE